MLETFPLFALGCLPCSRPELPLSLSSVFECFFCRCSSRLLFATEFCFFIRSCDAVVQFVFPVLPPFLFFVGCTLTLAPTYTLLAPDAGRWDSNPALWFFSTFTASYLHTDKNRQLIWKQELTN